MVIYVKKLLIIILLIVCGCSNNKIEGSSDKKLELSDEINIVNFNIKADFDLIYNNEKLSNIIFYNDKAIELFYNKNLEGLSIDDSINKLTSILYESGSFSDEEKIKITFHTESDTFEPSIMIPLTSIIEEKNPIVIEKIEVSKFDNMSKIKSSLVTEALEHDISTIEDLKKLTENEIIKLLFNYSKTLIEQYKNK